MSTIKKPRDYYFDYELDEGLECLTIQEGNVCFDVYVESKTIVEIGYDYTPATPAKTGGHPDTHSPAEGDEVQDIELWIDETPCAVKLIVFLRAADLHAEGTGMEIIDAQTSDYLVRKFLEMPLGVNAEGKAKVTVMEIVLDHIEQSRTSDKWEEVVRDSNETPFVDTRDYDAEAKDSELMRS
jgi:hypothetical protein